MKTALQRRLFLSGRRWITPRAEGRSLRAAAFTLIEVMIAASLLFLCLFAVLAVFSNSLRGARVVQHKRVDAGILAAQLSLTNRLTEGMDSGDFGNLYPDYRWEQRSYEVSSNGLWQVDFTVFRRAGGAESRMSILLYSPDSRSGPGLSGR